MVTNKAAKDADKLARKGTKAAQNQLKKARAAAVVLTEALSEARGIRY